MNRWLYIAALLGAAGCTVGGPEPVRSSGGDLHPSLMHAPALDVSRLATTEDCADCHADVASQWTHSAHAYASFDNPWYRASIDEFRKERGREESRFCAGCHDPLLLMSGDIDAEVTPDNPLAYAGITCLVCHSVESTRPDGNASFTLSDEPVLIPDPANEDEIEAHRARLTMKPLRSAALCGSCHRSFSGTAIGNENHLPGIDDLGDWASSAYAGAVPNHLVSAEEQTCQGCHMRPERASDSEMAGAHDGVVRTHRWTASHTALASQLPDRKHVEQARAELEGAVSVDIGAVMAGSRRSILPEKARIRGGERLVFDVLLQNERVGHRFPGGVRDLQDAWVQVEVRDAKDQLLGASRAEDDTHEGVFVLRATMLDGDAKPELLHGVHRFSAPAFDRTLEAHSARAVRYSMKLPPNVALPLRVEARLLHRKHSPEFQAFACEASRSERGLEFARLSAAHGKVALDPCLDPPLTEIGHARAWLGRGGTQRKPAGGAARPTVERLLTQGLALLHAKQEHVHLARPSIELARRLAREAESAELQARAFVLEARLAATEGRPVRAASLLKRAEALVGPRPILDQVRGDAFAQVWRWAAAAAAYQRVADASPLDFRVWRNLARAYGSLGRDPEALLAADAGLQLAPRDASLLRSRALALESLGDPRADQAKRDWLAHRSPDARPAILARCEESHQRCRRDRQPIPHYTLAPPAKPIHASADPG